MDLFVLGLWVHNWPKLHGIASWNNIWLMGSLPKYFDFLAFRCSQLFPNGRLLRNLANVGRRSFLDILKKRHEILMSSEQPEIKFLIVFHYGVSKRMYSQNIIETKLLILSRAFSFFVPVTITCWSLARSCRRGRSWSRGGAWRGVLSRKLSRCAQSCTVFLRTWNFMFSFNFLPIRRSFIGLCNTSMENWLWRDLDRPVADRVPCWIPQKNWKLETTRVCLVFIP